MTIYNVAPQLLCSGLSLIMNCLQTPITLISGLYIATDDIISEQCSRAHVSPHKSRSFAPEMITSGIAIRTEL